MAGGYGGQLVALNTLLPSEQSQLVGQANLSTAQGRVAQATVPFAITQAKEQARQSELKTATDEIATRRATEYDAAQRAYSEEESATQPTEATAVAVETVAPAKPTYSPGVDKIISTFKPGDPKSAPQFDAQMIELAKTDPVAKQFIGQYGKLGDFQGGMAASTVSQAVPQKSQLDTATPAAASPLAAAVSPTTGKVSRNLQRMMELDPEQTGKMLKLKAMSAFQQTGDLNTLKAYAPDVYQQIVTASTNLSKEQREQYTFNQEAVGTLAKTVLEVYGKDSPTTRKAYDSALDEQVKLGIITPQQAAQLKSQPIDWERMVEGKERAVTVVKGMELYNQGQRAEGTGSYTIAGTNPETGTGLRFNQHTGQLEDTGVVLGAKPGVNQAAFKAKYDQYLALNPGKEQEALQFANGMKAMGPQQAMVAARNQANMQAQIAANAGTPLTPYQVDALTQQYAAEYSAVSPQVANAAPAPAAGGRTKGGYTQQQADAAANLMRDLGGKFTGSRGDKTWPWAPKNDTDWKSVKPGQWYIDYDGTLVQRPGG